MNFAVRALTVVGQFRANPRRERRLIMERPSGRRLDVLLVDDCVAERELYQCVLEPEFHILTASGGAEGVALAVQHHPDVIVLDVRMPQIDGWETCLRIKSNPATADIPVLMLTGSDDKDFARHAKAVWASALLHKPCPGGILRSAILTAVEGFDRPKEFH
jgi:CheY-like chemotaxis protein